jgi:ubiquinone/menaquinone biosynthesis C-methylase UbiE
VEYVHADAQNLPFENNFFDAVFSNGSLHEWSQPLAILDEIYRVLRPGGHFFISDLRRNINPLFKWFMYTMTRPKEIRPGLKTSIKAAYTVSEVDDLLRQTQWSSTTVTKKVIGLEICGTKMNP